MSEAKVNLSGQGRERTVLKVEGMTCGHCANAVEGELAAVPGVVSAEVDLGAGTAMVVGGAARRELEAAVERAGYKVGSTT
jgi:copper chaperone CopZ